jgi:hypothetical protein
VLDLAVDDGGKAVLRVADDVFPDVEHRTARRVDERAALVDEPRHVAHGHAERGQDHDVVRAQRRPLFARIAQKTDPRGPQAIVDMRVVDDLAGQKDVAIGKAAPCLVGVIDGAIDAIAEAEFAREVNGQPSGTVLKIVLADLVDDPAVIGRGQLSGHGLLHVEALTKNQGLRGGHESIAADRSRARAA